MTVDPESLRRSFSPDPEKVVPVGLLVRGEPYKMDRHLFGAVKKATASISSAQTSLGAIC